MTAPVPDLDQARRFLTLLDEEASAFCFQTATDAEPKPDPDHLARVINLPPDNLKALAIRNGNGAAVWVMINAGDGGKVRRKENVRLVRAVFADLDGAPLAPVMACALEPHVVVESSEGRFHAYWLCEGLPLDQFEGVQRRIATMFGGDHVTDLCRVMRLPGFIHAKNPSAPFMVRIVHQAERLPYPAADILRVFPPLEREQGKADNGAGEAIDLPHQPPEPLSHARHAVLKESHGHLFDLDRYGGHHSQRDLALAGVAARLGWPIADAWALIIRLREGLDGKEGHKAYRRDYIASTLALAYRDVEDDQQSAERIERLIEQAAADPGAAFESGSVDFLAALRARDPAAYERARARLKKAHVRVAALDQEVERRKPEAEEAGDGKGKALDLPDPEPWGERVDGVELLADLVEQIRRFVILSDHAALGAALWVIHAHAHDTAFHSPRLTLTSPTMRCGKSTMLRTIGRLVPRPLPTANITPAAMFRVIEAAKPTLLIDEADSFAHENEELRGVINSSHCCLDAYVIRAVPAGDEYEARRFSTWAPMAIASIGKVAWTIADRSVLVGMERKAPGQVVARMRADRDNGFGMLASKAARWVVDHLVKLREADPETPTALNDRQADNWRPLLAIADLAGGDWPAKARAAARALSAADEDADTIGVQLLGDIKIVFGSTKAEAIWTEDLLRHLHAMAERPWCEYGRQRKPISPRQLATLLKPFGVAVRQVWKPEAKANKNGYASDQFFSAWGRYLSSKCLETTDPAACSDLPSSSDEEALEDEYPPKPAGTASSRLLGGREGESCPYQRKRVGQCPVCHFDVFHDNLAELDGVKLHRPCVTEWRRATARPQ